MMCVCCETIHSTNLVEWRVCSGVAAHGRNAYGREEGVVANVEIAPERKELVECKYGTGLEKLHYADQCVGAAGDFLPHADECSIRLFRPAQSTDPSVLSGVYNVFNTLTRNWRERRKRDFHSASWWWCARSTQSRRPSVSGA